MDSGDRGDRGSLETWVVSIPNIMDYIKNNKLYKNIDNLSKGIVTENPEVFRPLKITLKEAIESADLKKNGKKIIKNKINSELNN